VLAFTFPGQGSQRPGMGRPFVDHPSFEIVDEASRASGRDVARLLLDAGADELTETRNAQLATFTLSLVVLDAIERVGLEPVVCAGHSLGEYTALVASGSLSFDDGVRLVAERGEAMQAAADARRGTMAALIGLDAAALEPALAAADGEAWLANDNAPGQVVVAGTPEGVAAAIEAARSLGARKALPLPVGGAFHSPLMAPARDRLAKALSGVVFRPLETPVVANVDAQVHKDPDEWPELLCRQLCAPVRWRETLQTISALAGDRLMLVEAGPGTVLTGLARRVLPAAAVHSVASPDDLDALVEAVAGTGPRPADHHGEHLYASERLVVSPATGVFEPSPGLGPAAELDVGALVGKVGDAEVRSAFSGVVMGVLAVAGERVTEGQPVAWLRTAS
jgi:[acyl-carrier-protein] S-malonyltransferase